MAAGTLPMVKAWDLSPVDPGAFDGTQPPDLPRANWTRHFRSARRQNESPCSEFNLLIDHKVTFVLINRFGDRCNLGFRIFTGQTDRSEVFDEDGDTFPDLETAVRTHAAELMKVVAMPGRWRDRPARYDTWQGTVATAFNA